VAPAPHAWAVIVAGGSGIRFGSHKQFALLAGRPVLDWSLDAACEACAGVVVVVPGTGPSPTLPDGVAAVVGGVTRSDSVRAGLGAVPDDAEIIVVHDAARPLAGRALWAAVLDAVVAGADGAIPVVPVTDTVRRVDVNGGLRSVDRAVLRAVQTPQAFRAGILRRAHAAGTDATDDATLVESLGGTIALVDGHAANAKITAPTDLVVAAALLPAVLTW
jgi:2-C-methyl-D-erythritol 4-phosphate cytidylyltransferase